MTPGPSGSSPTRDPLAGLRPWISEIEPYVPGQPAGDDAGSLASNESPFRPLPEAETRSNCRLSRHSLFLA